MPADADLPRPFGPYLLTRRIASGGMAEVYAATTKGVGGFEKTVAIKLILPRYSEDEHFVQMLVEEAKICAQLTHANIGQVYDLGCIGDTYFIVMEYVEGVDAYRFLKRLKEQGREMPIEAAVYVAREVCQGLHYAHQRRGTDGQPLRIVHRDVSPQNVLLSFAGEVKLVDFGIAKAALRSQQTEAGVIKGKYYYMSPEQAWGDPVDHRSDVFSLGLVLHEWLTGRMVHRARNLSELLERVRKAEIAPPSHQRPDISPELDTIVMRSLRRNPEDRYTSAGEFAQVLGSYLHRHAPGFSPNRLAALLASTFPSHAPTISSSQTSTAGGTRERPAARRASPPSPVSLPKIRDDSEQEPTQTAKPSAAIRALVALPPPPSAAARNASAAQTHEDRPSPDASSEKAAAWDDDPTSPAASEPRSGVRRGPSRTAPVAPDPSSQPSPAPEVEDAAEEEPTASIFTTDRSWEDLTILDEEAELRARSLARAEGLIPPSSEPIAPPSSPSNIEARRPAAQLPTEKLGALHDLSVPVLASARGRRALVVAAVSLAVLLLVGALWWWSRASAPTRLRVESVPSGALVELDGQPVGRTPLSLRSPPLRPGAEQALSITAPGRRAERRTLRLEPGERRTLNVQLAPALVDLQVRSSPPGANLYVDGVFVGSTPFTLEDQPHGRRLRLLLKAPGHRDAERFVDIEGEDGSKRSIRIVMQPAPTVQERPTRRSPRQSSRRHGRRKR